MKTNHNVHLTIAGLAILLTTSVRADDLPTPAGTNLAVDTRAWTVSKTIENKAPLTTIVIAGHNHFDPTWRRCFDRPAIWRVSRPR